MSKTAAISEKIIMKFIETGSMKAAFNAIMGYGAYEKLASDIYDNLNNKEQ